MFRKKTKQNDEKNEILPSTTNERKLFTESDSKSMEIANEFIERLTTANSTQQTPSSEFPTGVADIDESVVLPTQQNLFGQPKQTQKIDENSLKSSESETRSHHHNHHNHRHHGHHEHHGHHPLCSHHRTYDPRWWYMPIGSVHGPKRLIQPEKRYVPPKWYE